MNKFMSDNVMRGYVGIEMVYEKLISLFIVTSQSCYFLT